jgi:Fe-S-cluster containining protein
MDDGRNSFAEKFSKKINGILIDPKIFTYKFICNCPGGCCYYGVYTDYKEYKTILSVQDKIKVIMDETQSKNVDEWFEPEEKDDDFESGIAVGTEVINGKCTFLDKDGLCTLQKLAILEGGYKWKYKPLYCILFPLTTYEGVLTIDTDHIDRLPYCNVDPDTQLTLFEACGEELRHFFGEEGFEELKNYRAEYLNEINIGVKEDVTK